MLCGKIAGYLVDWEVAQMLANTKGNPRLFYFQLLCNAIAKITTSISTVRMRIFFIPFRDACLVWTKIRVSASSWLQGANSSAVDQKRNWGCASHCLRTQVLRSSGSILSSMLAF